MQLALVVWSNVALAGVWGGLLALERRAFLQAMLSRPLVAATVMGWLLDDTSSGVFVGLLLELFHLGSANLGAAIPDNDTLSATCVSAAAAAMTNSSGGGGTRAIWALAVILFIGTGRLGRMMDRGLERYAGRLASRAQLSADEGNLTRAVRQNLWGMWPHFLGFGLVTALCAVAGYLIGPLVNHIPFGAVRGLAWSFVAMTSVAAAIAARGSHARHAAAWAGAAAAAITAVVGLFALGGRHP
jgi:mannose/fructose/N-acetylgalactosamine-specific phosphotransferase system component IIC